MAARDIGCVVKGGLLMGLLVVAVCGIAGHTVPEEAEEEQTPHHETQPIVPHCLARCTSQAGWEQDARCAVVLPDAMALCA